MVKLQVLAIRKAMTSWLLKGVIGHVAKVLDKIMKKDVRKGLLLGNYDGVEVEEYNVVNSNTNEDSMPPSNHQYVGEPTSDMLQVNNMGQL
jgi:hypothetical protein